MTALPLVIDPKKILKNAKIEANHKFRYPCILGRDIINELPKLKNNLDDMKEAVNTMTNEVKSYFSKINREKFQKKF